LGAEPFTGGHVQTVDDDIDSLYALLEKSHSDASHFRPDLTFAQMRLLSAHLRVSVADVD